MKKIIALVLIMVLAISGCGKKPSTKANDKNKNASTTETISVETDDDNLGDENVEFSELNDEKLMQNVEDNIYSELSASLDSENYIIENISTVYISKEYLEELEYNSKSNIYFGYTLEEVEAQFDGGKFIFTCDDSGKTIVKEYENYDDTYDKVLRNIAIGTGVILVCVTVSVVTGGLGMPAVSAVFAASAQTGTTFALSSGAISAATTALVKGFETGDIKETVKSAALAGSEGFKWGAITGVITGGVGKAIEISKAARTAKRIPSPRESEVYAESIFGGKAQQSYLDGKVVDQSVANATRPDIVIPKRNGAVEAIEVKNYNLASSSSRSTLYSELKRQITSRVKNLPKGSTQKIVLDTRKRGFSKELVKGVKKEIQARLQDVYPNIPIEIL